MDVARNVAASMRLHDGGRAFSALADACRNRDNRPIGAAYRLLNKKN